jgi:hypothetical protein
MSVGDGPGVVGLGATDFDEDGAHDAIKASGCVTFKSHDSSTVQMWIITETVARAPSAGGKKYSSHHILRGCCARDTVA